MVTLITGAVGNGKSLIAEDIVTNAGAFKLYYIATMHQYDKESKMRVARHREMRAQKGFETIEKYMDIGSIVLQDNSAYLLECVTNLLANEMFDKEGAKEKATEKIIEDIKRFKEKAQSIVIVTNEVSSTGDVYDEFSTQYIKNLAFINEKIAQLADNVIECVAGIPIYLKGEKYEFI